MRQVALNPDLSGMLDEDPPNPLSPPYQGEILVRGVAGDLIEPAAQALKLER